MGYKTEIAKMSGHDFQLASTDWMVHPRQPEPKPPPSGVAPCAVDSLDLCVWGDFSIRDRSRVHRETLGFTA